MIMSEKTKLNLSIEEETKKQAKILAVNTGFTVSEIFEMLMEGMSISEIEKEAKKRNKK